MTKLFVRPLVVSALQIAITLGILIFLFHDSAKRAQMGEALRRADWRWLLAGVFAYGAVEILGAINGSFFSVFRACGYLGCKQHRSSLSGSFSRCLLLVSSPAMRCRS